MNDYAGIEFLNKFFQNLYMSDEVQHTKTNKDNKKEAIQKYMDRLERIHKKADTETKKELLYSLYFDKYVIKEKDIPYGMDKEAIINAQKKSLGMWLEYLSNETANYPTWAKYWAFQGMLKMGSYDESKEVYLKRNNKTIAPFVSANAEIIAKSIETITKLVKGQEVTTDTLEKFDKMDSFRKIYTVFEKKYKENIVVKSDNINGEWKKYNQGSKEDAIKLSKSLENMNTGWCTASEDMAIKQICGPYDDAPDGGDFYVYYTNDKNGNYSIPRIAIRMVNHDGIGEIRGIEDGQNLEEKMVDVLENKLKEMSFLTKEDVEDNLKKVEGLRELTSIGKKTEKKEELTEKELNDLYTKKYGFGWTQDPRVKKIQDKRNILEDYNNINDRNIKVKFLTLEILPKEFHVNDKEVVLEAIKQNEWALEYASEDLRKDREFILEAVKQFGRRALEYASEELKNNREIVLEAVKQSGRALEYASEELRKDREFILEAVKQDGRALEYASEDLRNDKEIVLEAIKQDGMALEYASEELKKDREFILEAVKQVGSTLAYASEELKNDKEIVLEAVKQNGSTLKYASEELKNDKEIVLEAVKQDKRALKFASEELKNDKEIVLEAIKQDLWAQEYISEDLRKDREFILEAVKQDGSTLAYASEELKNDKEIVLEAVKQNGSTLESASEELKNDKEIVLEAIKQNGWALEYASEDLRNDKEIILEAIKQNGSTLKYASEELKNDKEIVLEAIKQNGWVLAYASEELRKDREFILEAVKQDGRALEYASEELKKDREFMLQLDEVDKVENFEIESLEKDKRHILEAVKQNLKGTKDEIRRITKESRRIIMKSFKRITCNINDSFKKNNKHL